MIYRAGYEDCAPATRPATFPPVRVGRPCCEAGHAEAVFVDVEAEVSGVGVAKVSLMGYVVFTFVGFELSSMVGPCVGCGSGC